MPNWSHLLNELKATGSTHDQLRRKYLKRLHEVTGRNVIAYYSGWMEKPQQRQLFTGFSLNDSDKNGFMNAIHAMDCSKGLDLLLHTPGGSMGATESLVDYLRAKFSTNIRAIIPQIAMSAGTMVALSCKEIVMGKQSSLGPIDPQIAGLPAHAILEEYQCARKDADKAKWAVPLWQAVLAKYTPGLIGECQKVVDWSTDVVKQWLKTGMFNGDPNANAKAAQVLSEFGDHSLTLSHDRHISMEKAQSAGVSVKALEDNEDLQDAVLSVHHAFCLTLNATNAYKIIENHDGVAVVHTMQQVLQPA